MTVTSHLNMLKIPDVINTDVAHVITGKIIQRACLNITESVIIKKIRIDIPNILRSLFTKDTTSFAIIGIPPKKISPVLSKFFMIFLTSFINSF